MSYLRDLGATSPDLTQTMSADDLLASFRSQPYTEKLKALASWHAYADRYLGLAAAKAAANSKWSSKWKKTFGIGAAFLAFSITLSKETAAKAYAKGAAIGSWLASHQDAPDDIKNDLKNAKFFLELIAKGSAEYGVDPSATSAQITNAVRQLLASPKQTTAVMRAGASTRTINWTRLLLLTGGVLVARKLLKRRA